MYLNLLTMHEFEVGAGKEGSTGTCIDPRPGAGEREAGTEQQLSQTWSN
jgi:hypothetical protein